MCCKGKRPFNSFLTPSPFLLIPFFILSLLFLLASCGPQKGRLRIKGEFENLPQADLLIYSPDGGMSVVDTLHIMKGRFDFTTTVPDNPEPFTFVIVYPNFSTLSFMAHTSSEIRIKGDALSLSQVQVEGADSVLADHPKLGRQPVVVGKRLPKSKIIRRTKNKWLLIGFWASWKHGSSTVNYYVRQALRDHSDSLQAFTYSLDVDPTTVQKMEAIDDTTRWQTYCDYRGWQGPLLSRFGIRNIPCLILVNPGDTVVAVGTNYNQDIKPHLKK